MGDGPLAGRVHHPGVPRRCQCERECRVASEDRGPQVNVSDVTQRRGHKTHALVCRTVARQADLTVRAALDVAANAPGPAAPGSVLQVLDGDATLQRTFDAIGLGLA